uniref:Purine nucleoside phosphorylase n=1 Tax=Parastrongyloides trichosuri TaxID=131310 RepID=A0A0N5A3S8_PARTI
MSEIQDHSNISQQQFYNGQQNNQSSEEEAWKDHPLFHRKLNPKNYDDIVEVADYIKSVAKLTYTPTYGIICGSGLGGIGDIVEDPIVVPYQKIPGFPIPKVPGHKGNLLFGKIGDKHVACLQGRFHPYEHDMNMALCSIPIRIFHLLGVKTLIVSNAAGGINADFEYGDLMIIKDHIFMPGLIGFSPLVGLKDPRFGATFVSVHDAYDYNLRKLALKVGKELDIRISEGVYVMSSGPQYETPAEVVLYKNVGADALGMSTCHEITVARQCGIKCFGFSLITNIANTDADKSVVVSHEEVLETSANTSARACAFVRKLLASME